MARNHRDRLYTGISENTADRLVAHNTKQGARFTRDGKYTIVFKEEHKTLKEARAREAQIKKWSRAKKENLIERFKKGLPTVF